MLLDRLSGGWRWAVELIVLTVSLGLASYLAYFMTRLVRVSYTIGDISQGADATPLWIPQLGMAAGSILLAMALAETMIEHLTGAVRARGRLALPVS